MTSILIIDDEQAICSSLEFALEDLYDVQSITEPYKGLNKIENEPIDIVLLDIKLGNINGLDILKKIKLIRPSTIVIMMTAYGSISSSVEAIEEGAYAYLTKPLQIAEVRSLIKQAQQFIELNNKVEYLRSEVQKKYSFEEIIANGFVMHRVLDLIDRVKDIDSNVLVTGESGTGKELVVRAIHYNGPRKNHNLVTVNCSAIPEHLLESELFGYEKGAFTGATQSKKGKFELAQNGTIFLDEIGDMPLTLQAKLLRVIEQREVTRLGSETTVKLNVRIISATNKNLEQAVKNGEFREDLYYRLNVIEIPLPPLRERKQDLPLLIDYFRRHYNEKFKRNIREISREALQWLLNYDYPGNIRELANIMESAIVVARGDTIELSDLPQKYVKTSVLPKKEEMDIDTAIEHLVGLPLKTIEEKIILATLKHNNFHKKKTAKMLGITERGLRGKLHRLKEESGKVF